MPKFIKRSAYENNAREGFSALDEVVGNEDFDITVARELLEGLDCPTSLGIEMCLRYGDLKAAITHEVNPSDYQNWRDYFDAKQAVSLLSKYPFKRVQGINPEEAARQGFLFCEDSCKKTNNAFRSWLGGRIQFPPDVEAAFFAARFKIQNLLAEFDPQEWLLACRFGPGAVFGTPGESDYQKLQHAPSITPEFVKLGSALLNECTAWTEALTYGRNPVPMVIVPGGKYSQVPKNAKTNRNIETQPLLNSYAQLGIGMMLRRRLLKARIDLNDQTRNQELARLASINGRNATMDLSNASDTIAREVVKYLLPHDWYYAMESCRTHQIRFDKDWLPLERFCSMGNGFAFELESLIFWALSTCAIENKGRRVRVSVYGDDIIVPSDYFDTVARILWFSGFSVNTRKSFKSGAFRESCGADWFLGQPVRPFFITKGSTNVASLVSLANGLRRSAHRRSNHIGYDRRFASAWFRVVRRIPLKVRRRIAFGFTEHDDIILSGRCRDGSCIVFKSRKLPVTNWRAALATALYRLDRRCGTGFNPDIVTSTVEAAHLEKSDGHIFDYRRNCGKWALRKYRHVVRDDPTMQWW